MKTERRFALFSFVMACLHFVFETGVHVKWGQFLPMLIVDYIAIALLIGGAMGVLRWNWGPGLLCGAWGFEFCLNYRTFFIRVHAIMEGTANDVTTTTAYILGALLVFSIPVFLYAVLLCVRRHRMTTAASTLVDNA
ncbi:MAG: hypothetical protein AAGC71_03910 [Pseudomonadota bacterium]